MANKNIIKYTAVPYQIGSGATAKTGYRPQLVTQPAVADEAFAQEIVDGVRLSTTDSQFLYFVRCFIKKGLELSCGDGRPRTITDGQGKVIFKFNPISQGNLESPTSAWDKATCFAYVRPQVFAESKAIDATFQNVETGVGVKLDNVTYEGAQTVVNVVKTNTAFSAYGRNMQFDAAKGDTAKLVLPDLSEKALACTASDVAFAKFGWPAGYAPEVGTKLTFVMKSRGGVEGGEVYTSKKEVTVVA